MADDPPFEGYWHGSAAGLMRRLRGEVAELRRQLDAANAENARLRDKVAALHGSHAQDGKCA